MVNKAEVETPKMGKVRNLRVPARDLTPHPLAQRQLSDNRVKYLSDNFDPNAVGIIHVVEYPRNGKTKLWIVDGQHRWKTIMENGFGDMLLQVEIHIEVTNDAEASKLFLALNNHLAVRPYDLFKNAVIAGVPEAVHIQKIVELHGMSISQGGGLRKIAGVNALERAYRLDTGHSMDEAIGISDSAWHGNPVGLEGKFIFGLSLLLWELDGQLNRKTLVEKLAKCDPANLLGDAKQLCRLQKMNLSRALAERILDIYNSRRGTKLELKQVA